MWFGIRSLCWLSCHRANSSRYVLWLGGACDGAVRSPKCERGLMESVEKVVVVRWQGDFLNRIDRRMLD